MGCYYCTMVAETSILITLPVRKLHNVKIEMRENGK